MIARGPNRAGLFEQHLIRRFNNLLGRTMWESPGSPDDLRFMVTTGSSAAGADGPPRDLLAWIGLGSAQ
jgi:hypothetical protein